MRLVVPLGNAPFCTTTKVMDWMVARHIKLIEHSPYSLDLAPTNFFLFPEMKWELAGLTLTQRRSRRSGRGMFGVLQRQTLPRLAGVGFSAMSSVSRS
jgi:hypothetical protein